MLSFFKLIEDKKILVELQLPHSIKIYHVFHLNLLCKAFIDPLINQVNDPPPSVIISNKKEWEVENILDARSHQGKCQY